MSLHAISVFQVHKVYKWNPEKLAPQKHHCIKCFKKWDKKKWPDLSYSFLPIEYCVRINSKPDYLFSGDIQS